MLNLNLPSPLLEKESLKLETSSNSKYKKNTMMLVVGFNKADILEYRIVSGNYVL